MRESDTLARTGGDEFVAVLFGIETVRDAEIVGNGSWKPCATPSDRGHELFVCASVGLSLFPEDGRRHGTLQNTPMWPCTRRRAGAETAFSVVPTR